MPHVPDPAKDVWTEFEPFDQAEAGMETKKEIRESHIREVIRVVG